MNNDNFKKDIIDLFSHKKGGHVQKWLYSDHIRNDGSSGSELWHNFITSNQKYYPIQQEIDLIPNLIRNIDRDYDTIIDFGLGDRRAITNKTIPILTSQTNLKQYVAIDISANQLNAGLDLVQCQFQDIKINLIKGNFYEKQNTKGSKKLGLFLGTTISNQNMMVGEGLPEQAIIERIQTLAKTVGKNGTIIISIDTNPDLQNALDAYQHPSWISMMTGLMHDVEDILFPEGNFEPTLWHYAPIIDYKNHVIQQVISPTIDQDFYIDNQHFQLNKGQKFVVKNNFKYPIDLFMDVIKKAGLKEKPPSISENKNSMILVRALI